MLRLVPLCLVGLLAGLEGGARPRSYRGPALAELGHPDVTTGDAACLRRYSKVQQRGSVIHAPTGAPALASLRTPWCRLRITPPL